jgi:hypothetical protein
MRIITKNQVEINSGINSKISTKVVGMINSVVWMNDFSTVAVTYIYMSESGSFVKSGNFEISGEEINQMSDLIKPILPENFDELNEIEQNNYKFYSAFKLKMAETFSLEMEDIEYL